MAWTVYGEYIATGAATTGTFQAIKFNKDIILTGCRAWLIFYNNPSVTNISMKVYSDNRGQPGKLLHTSTKVWTKSQIITEANGVREIYFDWDSPSFDGDDLYHFGLFMTGYTGTDSTHIAWRQAWPDPVYATNYTPTMVNLGVSPRCLYFIGSDLE